MFRRTRLASPVASWSRRCVLAEAVLVSLALPLPSSAQQLPMLPFGRLNPEGGVSIYVLIGQSRRLPDNRIEVLTRSGAWKPFPPDGIWTSGKLMSWHGVASLDLRLARTRLDEIRLFIQEEIPPHKWGWITEWKCQIDCGAGASKF